MRKIIPKTPLNSVVKIEVFRGQVNRFKPDGSFFPTGIRMYRFADDPDADERDWSETYE